MMFFNYLATQGNDMEPWWDKPKTSQRRTGLVPHAVGRGVLAGLLAGAVNESTAKQTGLLFVFGLTGGVEGHVPIKKLAIVQYGFRMS